MTTINTTIQAKKVDNYNFDTIHVEVQMDYDLGEPVADFADHKFSLSELESIVADMKYVKEKEEA
ncbi:hypothetical protein NVP1063O_149 [Vibrio phage 1.063.O._10N.261.45.C7]|nr:hypothetical protein NVP1063O_149 [Vibrio phage 1.063.O._10N.261.45.C7]